MQALNHPFAQIPQHYLSNAKLHVIYNQIVKR
jgi:hypothetical protein